MAQRFDSNFVYIITAEGGVIHMHVAYVWAYFRILPALQAARSKLHPSLSTQHVREASRLQLRLRAASVLLRSCLNNLRNGMNFPAFGVS